MVKNLPSNAGDMGSIPGWRTKIPHAVGQLSRTSQLEKPLSTATRESPSTALKTQSSQKMNQ